MSASSSPASTPARFRTHRARRCSMWSNRRWSFEMCDALGLDRAILPAVYESHEVTGKLTAEVAGGDWVSKPGTPVVGGGGDQAASAVGNGIVEAGIVSCTLGTSGVVFAHMDQPRYDPQGRVHTFCHAVPKQMACDGRDAGRGSQPAMVPQPTRCRAATTTHLTAGSEQRRRAARKDLFWLPYLMGERTPHLDASCARRLDRPDRQPHPRRPDPLRDRRRLLQPEGLPRHHRRHGRAGRLRPAFRRRRAESLLAADDGGCARQARRDARIAGRLGLWRGAAGDGRHRRLRHLSKKPAAPRFAKWKRVAAPRPASHKPMRNCTESFKRSIQRLKPHLRPAL